MELAILVVVLVSGLSLLGVVTWLERVKGPLRTVELRFGADVTVEKVEAMLASVAGLRSNSVVLLDVVADEHGIRHFLHAPGQTIDTLRSQWRGVLPSLRMDTPEGGAPLADWRGGVVVRLSGARPVLRSDASAQSASALLGAMMPLVVGERLLVRWWLGAGAHPSLPSAVSRRDARRADSGLAHLLLQERSPQADHVRALRAKYAGALLSGVAIVAAGAGHPKRAAHLLGRVTSMMRSRGGAYGHLMVRRRGRRRLSWLLARQNLRRPDLYAPSELAGLLAVPVGAPQVPGLTLGTAPLLMASPRIPSAGRMLAVSTWPGGERPLAQPVIGGLSHTVVCGPTGTGKSELVATLALQDVRAGRGLLLFDGKGDTAESVLARIPSSRCDDVIALDPGREGPVPGLRLFSRGSDPQLTADLVLGTFADLFAESWGPLSARWLRAGLLLLAHDETASLADLPFVFSDDGYRRRLVGRLDDPLARETWRMFEAMGPAERAHKLAAPLQKVEELVGRRVIRSVVGQAAPKLDMGRVLATGKIVVVSLSPGRIGSLAARLIGALVLFKFFEAVQARSTIAPAARRPFFAYVDEPAVLADVPVPLDDLYALARGLGVGLSLSTQSLAQLPTGLRAAALSNAATLVAFGQNSSADARLLGGELGVEPEGLQHLEKFQALFRIGLGPGDIAPPASGRTLPLPSASGDPETVRRASAARYGTDPAEVDAALLARHEGSRGEHETPVGRRRSAR